MERHLETMVGTVQRLIKVDPDKLIELGHKIKALAMDEASIGTSILVPFTDGIHRITFVYTPEKEFCKPTRPYLETVQVAGTS
jgi:hypothetical protein